jgi:hypothetical protein
MRIPGNYHCTGLVGLIIPACSWRGSKTHTINPRILLSLLEFSSGWVTKADPSPMTLDYPMNYYDIYHKGLYS